MKDKHLKNKSNELNKTMQLTYRQFIAF